MKKVELKIDGIHCDNCRSRIKKVLEKNEEIKTVNVNDNVATIEYENDLDHEKVIDTINSIGFETKEEYFSEK